MRIELQNPTVNSRNINVRVCEMSGGRIVKALGELITLAPGQRGAVRLPSDNCAVLIEGASTNFEQPIEAGA